MPVKKKTTTLFSPFGHEQIRQIIGLQGFGGILCDLRAFFHVLRPCERNSGKVENMVCILYIYRSHQILLVYIHKRLSVCTNELQERYDTWNQGYLWMILIETLFHVGNITRISKLLNFNNGYVPNMFALMTRLRDVGRIFSRKVQQNKDLFDEHVFVDPELDRNIWFGCFQK